MKKKLYWPPVEESIIDELKEMKFEVVEDNIHDLFFVCKNDALLVRVLPGMMQISSREAFDKWSNSDDFTIYLESYNESGHEWSCKRPLEIATKIIESKIVDFNKFEFKGVLSLDVKK